MTKNFYEKNYEFFVPLIEICECGDSDFCNNSCPIRDACLYYYTGDDVEFENIE